MIAIMNKMSIKHSSAKQDFHAISSLIQHYNPLHKKASTAAELEMPEPELCPKPHSLDSEPTTQPQQVYLSVPGQNLPDTSFASLSSRADNTKRSIDYGRRGDLSKRSIDMTKRCSSPYTSPRTAAQEMERLLAIEQQIRMEKEKYRKLEKKYKELMNEHSQNQARFEIMVQELQKKIEQKKGKCVNAVSVAQKLREVRIGVASVDVRLSGALNLLG
jgi:hypothetical protein